MAIRTIIEKWEQIQEHTNIPKDIFVDILTFCIKDTRYFKYEDKFYEQRKGMPMGSPASPIIADIIMEKLLDASIEKMTLKPRFFTKYVDDIFCVIKKSEVDNTLEILNKFNSQIQFTMECETDNKLPYLDAIVYRQDNQLKVDWYQKDTASGRLINFFSKHPRRIVINTATNFIKRILDISDKQFHSTNEGKIRTILHKNDFPNTTINKLIKHVKRRELDKNGTREQAAKIYKSTTYVPGFSERFSNSDIYNKDNIQLALKNNNTVGKFFSKTKSRIEKEDQSNIVYKIRCNGDKSDICQKVYVGTTRTKLKTRVSGHKSDQKAIDRPLEQKTALAAHCTLTGHTPNFTDVEILTQESNYKKRYTLEMLHIINVPSDERMNYKTDTDKIAHIYRNIVQKHRHIK